MKLQEWIDIRELEELISEGLVSDRPHPSLPLRILNYTPAAQSVKVWTPTLSRCRGLVYELDTNDIYAIPFSKFWNFGDLAHGAVKENFPPGEPAIYEKVDGSLGIFFFYKGAPIIATRGSFESDQAKWADNWRKKHMFGCPLHDDRTYLFEIVYPEDKKVVNYPYSGLVLLGAIDPNGDEWPPDSIVAQTVLNYFPVKIAKRYEYQELEKLQAQEEDNAEGWVAVWYGPPAYRVKIKLEKYVLLHRMYFQTTSEVVWELVKAGEFKEVNSVHRLFEGADDTLKKWVMNTAVNISLNYVDIDQRAKLDFRNCIDYTNITSYDGNEKERRKAFAFLATKKDNPSLLFLLYDGDFVKYEEMLWKLVKPENKRFTKEEE
jgi:RNA ligase